MRYREHRCPCDHPVSVTLPDGRRTEAMIINISQGGARLARIDGLSPGMQLRLSMGSGCMPRDAQVRWAHSGFAGLRFGQRIDSRTMAVVRKSVAHQARAQQTAWNPGLREMR